MESIYTKLCLYCSTNECARTDNVFLLISDGDGTVSLRLPAVDDPHDLSGVEGRLAGKK